MKADRTRARTSATVCRCANPWRQHFGFVFERGDGTAHYPQRYVSGARRPSSDVLKRHLDRWARAPSKRR